MNKNITIQPIAFIEKEKIEKMGFNGYKTNKIMVVEHATKGLNMSIEVCEEMLDYEYVKEWTLTDKSVEFFNNIAGEGYSLAAFEGERLIGFAVMSYIGWNDTFWIENIRVSEDYIGFGVGWQLIEGLKAIVSDKRGRLLGLEAQSTNYPAIRFYKKCGFEITGIDLHKYPQRENDLEQVGIIMSFVVKG
jgi:ribosomal protein S18 acetylase RimI-like enzyme